MKYRSAGKIEDKLLQGGEDESHPRRWFLGAGPGISSPVEADVSPVTLYISIT
jgi:hypothetical protein